MTRSSLARFGRVFTALAAATVLAAGCAGQSSTSATDATDVTTGLVGEQPDGGDAVSGGMLSYATYNAVSSLDPADRQDGGATGGTEMAAIYDVLMRYDTATKEYQPQLAQSLTPNGDNTVWTLKLRDGVKFSDGTALDAAAVQWSIDHYLEKKGTHTQVWKVTVDKVESPDPSTVVFTLKQPWNEFPIMFTTGPGMIVAPSSTANGTFTPIGAGPFTVEKFASQNELVLAANPGYWDGRPNLDKLRFPAIVGEQAKLDALHSGGIQAAYLRAADTVHNALEAGDVGYVYTASMGGVQVLNQREGRAASDPRVREAIVKALNPETFNERGEGGFGMPGTDMFQSWSQWHGNVSGSTFDPDTARKVLAEAKADGYDGKLTYAGLNEPGAQRRALAIQSMLQAVGFTVDIVYNSGINDLVKMMYAKHDFDLGESAFNVLDESPFMRMYGNLASASTSNVLGYQNPEMDALLGKLQSAPNDDDRRRVLEGIQTLVNETNPMMVLGAGKYFIPWSKNAHGITPSADGVLLFGNAWLTPDSAS
ncbi:ABC transporter substrate-binding protein [Prescottella equi]|uniref:ABC transporter substrate-binding protein n=1 Tax=Rhodococcus hoagii TaxID=43767 RepID=A0AAE3B9N7_RHOHA|nr:ABC transporter substrate-binding protein [Prescottella equi]MBM4468081.1 ABC transporter substrate-binding protein [Prescottella equi]MBM4493880.1 ABC transporter substrate-binding protein [Prescottella equi]MBM4539312.1 ABC transporter substrate-binding protein [Prescottella equi]MBM4713578.1 ABC transporter substrate-binding protein [Prescottella equi]NKR96850.1 ABC transporter substrate-binding protein [Prescottella equi]